MLIQIRHHKALKIMSKLIEIMLIVNNFVIQNHK